MSQLSAFLEALRHDPEALEQLKALREPDAVVAHLVETAHARGFEVTAEEIRANQRISTSVVELCDADLSAVSGGGLFTKPTRCTRIVCCS